MSIQGGNRPFMVRMSENHCRHPATRVGSEDHGALLAVLTGQAEPAIFALSTHLLDYVIDEASRKRRHRSIRNQNRKPSTPLKMKVHGGLSRQIIRPIHLAIRTGRLIGRPSSHSGAEASELIDELVKWCIVRQLFDDLE